jgi:ABC-2 type transport system ATP-binding protein
VIELEHFGVRFGRHQVLDDLSGRFSGRAIGLLGPNGAGKTTLIHTLLGFYKPSSGTGRIFGLDTVRQGKEIRKLVGYMPERDSFIANMTGVRFVRLMAELSGLPPKQALERAHEVFFYVGLGEARYRKLGTYSLGMKQLAKLAQAIVHGPRLLFLDEPTNGLDPPARVRMLRLVREIRSSGKCNVILSSHLLHDVEECCEEVLILKRGKIANYCNLEEERRSNRKFLELEVHRPRARGEVAAPSEAEAEDAASAAAGTQQAAQASFADALRALGCDVAILNRRRLKAVLPFQVEIRDLYQAADQKGLEIRRLDYRRDSLEDIFLRAMGDDDGRL